MKITSLGAKTRRCFCIFRWMCVSTTKIDYSSDRFRSRSCTFPGSRLYQCLRQTAQYPHSVRSDCTPRPENINDHVNVTVTHTEHRTAVHMTEIHGGVGEQVLGSTRISFNKSNIKDIKLKSLFFLLLKEKKWFKFRMNPENRLYIHAILLFIYCNWVFENQTESRDHCKHPGLLWTLYTWTRL